MEDEARIREATHVGKQPPNRGRRLTARVAHTYQSSPISTLPLSLALVKHLGIMLPYQ